MRQPLPERRLSRDAVTRVPSGIYPARATLAGSSVRLEPLDPTLHCRELWESSAGHDDIWEYLPYGPFANRESFGAWLRECAGAPDPIFFAIRDGRDDRAAGMCSIMSIRPAQGVVELGHIWLAPSLQRTRQATEALYLLMRYLMDDLGYRRLEWKCNALNTGSRAAAERLGFAFEGVFYQAAIVKGHNRDTAWFSILDREWPAIRRNIEAWLSPGNFDADGRQRASLGAMNRALRDRA
jgi:RimJ/RimL family protein N-acetyltransferase